MDHKHKFKQGLDGESIYYRCTVDGCGVKHHTECQQWRRALVSHGILGATAADFKILSKDWETDKCKTPLFSEAAKVRGTCDSCARGWTHENNYPVDAPAAADAAPAAEAKPTKPCAVCERELQTFQGGGVKRHKCPLPGADPFGFRLAKGERCTHRMSARTTDGRCTHCGEAAGPVEKISREELEAAAAAASEE